MKGRLALCIGYVVAIACACCMAVENIHITNEVGHIHRVRALIDIAYLGNLSTYHVEIEGGHMIKAQTANTTRLERRSFTWEDTVWLSWTDTAAIVLEG